jgi:membrane-associated phospholipid phosphatase
MRASPCLGLAALVAAALAHPAAASDSSWKTVSNVGLAGVVALAAGDTFAHQDAPGGLQLGISLGATEAITFGLKHTIHETRPNGRNDKSFPSGHTSFAFAAAGYLDERYGWQVGLPAFGMAGLVGLARVEAHEHHWYDAVAGAGLGTAAAFIATKPLNENVRVTPWASGTGLTLLAKF